MQLSKQLCPHCVGNECVPKLKFQYALSHFGWHEFIETTYKAVALHLDSKDVTGRVHTFKYKALAQVVGLLCAAFCKCMSHHNTTSHILSQHSLFSFTFSLPFLPLICCMPIIGIYFPSFELCGEGLWFWLPRKVLVMVTYLCMCVCVLHYNMIPFLLWMGWEYCT